MSWEFNDAIVEMNSVSLGTEEDDAVGVLRASWVYFIYHFGR